MLIYYSFIINIIFAYAIGLCIVMYPWVAILLLLILYLSKTVYHKFFIILFCLYGANYIAHVPRNIYGQAIYQNNHYIYIKRNFILVDKIRYKKAKIQLGHYYRIKFLPYNQQVLTISHGKPGKLSYIHNKRLQLVDKYKQYPLLLALCLGEVDYINPNIQIILKQLNLWVLFVGSGIITRVFFKFIIKIIKHVLGLSEFVNYNIPRHFITFIILIIISYLYSQLTIPHIGSQRIILSILLNYWNPFNTQEIFWLITSYQLLLQPYLIFSWSFQISVLMSILYRLNIKYNIFLLLWFNQWNIFGWVYMKIFIYLAYIIWILMLLSWNNYQVLQYIHVFMLYIIKNMTTFGLVTIDIPVVCKKTILIIIIYYIYKNIN